MQEASHPPEQELVVPCHLQANATKDTRNIGRRATAHVVDLVRPNTGLLWFGPTSGMTYTRFLFFRERTLNVNVSGHCYGRAPNHTRAVAMI